MGRESVVAAEEKGGMSGEPAESCLCSHGAEWGAEVSAQRLKTAEMP